MQRKPVMKLARYASSILVFWISIVCGVSQAFILSGPFRCEDLANMPPATLSVVLQLTRTSLAKESQYVNLKFQKVVNGGIKVDIGFDSISYFGPKEAEQRDFTKLAEVSSKSEIRWLLKHLMNNPWVEFQFFGQDVQRFNIGTIVSQIKQGSFFEKLQLHEVLSDYFYFSKDFLSEVDLNNSHEISVLKYFSTQDSIYEFRWQRAYEIFKKQYGIQRPTQLSEKQFRTLLGTAISGKSLLELAQLLSRPKVHFLALEKALQFVARAKMTLFGYVLKDVSHEKVEQVSFFDYIYGSFRLKIFSVEELADLNSSFHRNLIRSLAKKIEDEQSKSRFFTNSAFETLNGLYSDQIWFGSVWKRIKAPHEEKEKRKEWNAPRYSVVVDYLQRELGTSRYNSMLRHLGVFVRHKLLVSEIKQFRTEQGRWPEEAEIYEKMSERLGVGEFYRSVALTAQEFLEIKNGGSLKAYAQVSQTREQALEFVRLHGLATAIDAHKKYLFKNSSPLIGVSIYSFLPLLVAHSFQMREGKQLYLFRIEVPNIETIPSSEPETFVFYELPRRYLKQFTTLNSDEYSSLVRELHMYAHINPRVLETRGRTDFPLNWQTFELQER